MLVNATDMLNKAREGKYAVGHFNINNLEWAKSILLTAQEMNAPVILGVSEGAGKYMGGFKVVADMVKALTDSMEITVPVALHLDHGTYEGCYKCIKAGFSSIMFDGSHYPILASPFLHPADNSYRRQPCHNAKQICHIFFHLPILLFRFLSHSPDDS